MKTYMNGVSAARVAAMTALLAAATPAVAETSFQEAMHNIFNETFSENSLEIASTARAALQPSCFDEDPTAQNASVLLLSMYSDGTITQGTGTIILGSANADGYDKVLTASHVVQEVLERSEYDAEILETHAFSSDGSYLASLSTTLIGDPRTGYDQFDKDTVGNDVAVLEVTGFATDVSQQWNTLGAEISPILPDTLFIGAGPVGGMGISPGMSGAAIMNDNNQVIGVVSNALWPVQVPGDTGRLTDMHENFLNGRGLSQAPYDVQAYVANVAIEEPRLYRNGIAGVAAISQFDVMSWLNVDPAETKFAPVSGSATVSGYPSVECISEEINIVRMPNFETPLDLDPQHAAAYQLLAAPEVLPEQGNYAFEDPNPYEMEP